MQTFDGEYLGVVLDNKDPEFRGRCKVRVFGVYTDIQESDLPWAHRIYGHSFGSGGGSGEMSVPKLGSIVRIKFNNGNYLSPEYYASQEISPDLKQEISTSYEGSHSLVYDGVENLKIFYTVDKGLIIELKGSNINIANDNSITIKHNQSSSIIELRGNQITMTTDSEISMVAPDRIQAESSEIAMRGRTVNLGTSPVKSAVTAEDLWSFLKLLATAVDTKLPATPGVNSSMASLFEILSTSKTVKITN